MNLPHFLQEIAPYIERAGRWGLEHIGQAACLLAYSVWECWLGKNKKTVSSSTLEMVALSILKLFRGDRKNMEQEQKSAAQPDKEIQLGSVGELELDFTHGKARIALSAKVPGDVGVSGGAFIECDSEQLINKLFEALQKKLPDSVDPIADTVKLLLVNAVKAIP